ncbi:MAG: dephospho-CoA kinase, partial [Oscillospiraceae bacterium]|nr:dephospho-CoA kinase [Oscillospiraceae bacterium]
MKSKAITLIGLTGQTGAGKSTVSAYLRSWGCRVVDADSAARRAVQRGSECLLRIAGAFGEGILLPDGSLDRARLGRLVFSDKEKKKTLEGIIFPYIMAVVDKDIESGREEGEAAVFLDAPTLFESGA